ncbi:inorganic pyrophosphatase (plasmid) [Natrialba magadii ATCC 43099]|uniref:inorganic diphosphatase n=1 Tax=Natrialba magadii (strain ATCC 43099 / DSM 3394 / CCM 3739 / CIP 104546 / IAM 13178 / JCM 8861 / NBRC 102185 / NCIMB 2190 / MS3) TaxID=547559 RepID=D3T1Z4_NATMM|nr:manganese-dependent inorganic pyrophosphatase [Natrialba magadii]ADD07603.1 inorganic pyrophosphatase [Natrialba magadii ATCC 43099]ELY27078.1 manganese-dependent inorganic pyrophosphatase [Natrialba magadii ATCC 43099]
MSQPLYVIGHQQPDTDAVCSALAYAWLKQSQEVDAVPARAGEVNPETQFVLNFWSVQTPPLLEDAATERLILVDHNEYSQTVPGAREAEIVEIVDHHRIGDVTTSNPIFFRNEPVGSTATILTHLYDEADEPIDSETAGLLLSGLLSDTVVLRSPTTTDTDRVVAERLAETAGVEIETYGKDLLQQKSKLGNKSPREMVLGDFKEFEFGSHHVGIGQVETVTPEAVLEQQAVVLAAMDDIVDEREFTTLLLLVTDLLDEDSTVLVAGDYTDTVADALDTTFTDQKAFLPGVMSRKKQVVPSLEDAFS